MTLIKEAIIILTLVILLSAAYILAFFHDISSDEHKMATLEKIVFLVSVFLFYSLLR